MSSFRIVKRKARGFFKPQDVPTIKDAVQEVHQILTNASILVRAFYLQWFQHNHPLEKDQQPLEVDKTMLSMACNIVQGDTSPAVRGNGEGRIQKMELFTQMFNAYQSLYDRCPELPKVISKLSLSHVLAYSIETLLTAYNNNITLHFSKYPKRFIICDLLSKGVDLITARKAAFALTNNHLHDLALELPQGIIDIYEHLFPHKMTKKNLPRSWDLQVHPWHYLYKMVQINQSLETDFPMVHPMYRKLLNPLPFHSSFVPMHIRLDTSGLSQLLMDKSRIKDFKNLYEAEHPGTRLSMETKADMLSSFEKLFGRPAASAKESGHYATDLWAFLTQLKTCKHWVELQGTVRKNDPNKVKWVFDNAVVTDGVSISFQVIDSSCFGRKTLAGRKKVGKRIKDVDKEPTFDNYIDPRELKNYKVLGCDPGKHDILAITDGHTTLCYTKGQRNQDIFRSARVKETLKRKRSTGLEVYETQVLNKYPKRSCHPEVFKRYAFLRKQQEDAFSRTYNHHMFREFKFTTFSKTKSSEHRFVNRVFKTFSQPRVESLTCMTHAMKENACMGTLCYKEILIGWGNWGKNPNALKGTAPTPGVGIRKRVGKFFRTVTVNEFLTSQTCPCCCGERCLKKARIHGSEEKHHLLRCTNDDCKSRWWNRNVVGSFNILKRLLESQKLPSNETTGVRPKRRQPLKSRT